MAKYNKEFKLMIVKEYLEGSVTCRLLAKKYGIKSDSQVYNWVAIYKSVGESGLERMENKRVYSVQFKLDVLSFMKRTGASYMDTALKFGIPNYSTIANWNKLFLEKGFEALDKPKGRPPMSNKKESKPIKDKKMTREKQLERENELLRLEVSYLKKLKAFQMDPKGYLEKHKQRYH
ncbi:transposase [Latilactobacillus curvatus]|uniref:Transposase n=1 Tax=Latilactobacillus curvatus TaxID=28038 RepID=A0A385AD35_LATCU|nr:helix-turn-helix domain-containing protein [Latilactobacillus curvatus]AXN35259.1 transposase [Latilactobacillus curvatus]AXN35592.1 transposase [Latilactobacillus curvatus]AXN36108.1 transposase [Latilactobacillus curvatus]MCA9767127.1 transposase [Carnobacterium sp.]